MTLAKGVGCPSICYVEIRISTYSRLIVAIDWCRLAEVKPLMTLAKGVGCPSIEELMVSKGLDLGFGDGLFSFHQRTL